MREYYADFYRTVGLLGFENKNNKILSTVAYQKIRGRVFRRGIRAPSVRGFALDGMECAAELLGLDVGTIYTQARFNERLREACAAVELPETLSGLHPAQENALAVLGGALELVKRPVRVKFLAGLIRSVIAGGRPYNLLPMAALLTDEFSAALYLACALPE